MNRVYYTSNGLEGYVIYAGHITTPAVWYQRLLKKFTARKHQKKETEDGKTKTQYPRAEPAADPWLNC